MRSLKNKYLVWILALSGLLVYIVMVSKWNREMVPPAVVRSDASIYESAKKEIELSYLKNRDTILADIKYPVLIYRYSHDYCSSCIVENLSELYKFQNEIEKDKIVIMPAFEEDQINMETLASQLASFKYKNTPANLLVFPKDKDGFTQRYFALIDNKGNLGEIYFPKRGDSEATKAYFQRVKGYFNSVRE